MSEVDLVVGECVEGMRSLPDASFGAVVCDPPYALGFMERAWDSFEPRDFQEWCQSWATECLRLLKPGGHLLSFGGARTFHRLTCGIEDAGFEVRDVLMWLYGSGWPKSHDAAKTVDAHVLYGRSDSRALKRVNDEARQGEGRLRTSTQNKGVMGERRGARIIRDEPATEEGRAWRGYGTALKPAYEPILLARKPFKGRLPKNLLEHGVGALDVYGTRIESEDGERWPANVLLDGDAGQMLADQAGDVVRFFYCAKPSAAEKRAGVTIDGRHDTVKPLALMRYLVRMVVPPGQRVLDPFAGSGTTGLACLYEGRDALLMEQDEEHAIICRQRLDHHAPMAEGAR
jgi:site-specific DNA-methyltransferase (adenine-specific)